LTSVQETIVEETDKKNLKGNGIFVDFSINREVWDVHKLSDGTKVRARVILTSMMTDKSLQEVEKSIRNGQKPKLATSINFQTLWVTESPIELRGQAGKSKYTKDELKSTVVAPNLDFETLYQSWNVYSLGYGHTLKVRLTPIDISRTSNFDDNGMPVYVVDFSIDAKMELSPELQKLVEKNRIKSPSISPQT
jgi:hypothetical protein